MAYRDKIDEIIHKFYPSDQSKKAAYKINATPAACRCSRYKLRLHTEINLSHHPVYRKLVEFRAAISTFSWKSQSIGPVRAS